MTGFDLLAEMRMREWLQRPAAERASSPPDVDPALPLEIQLLRDVVLLDHMATHATGFAGSPRMVRACGAVVRECAGTQRVRRTDGVIPTDR